MKSGVRRPQTARDCTWPFRSVVRGGGVGGSLSGRTGHVSRPAGDTVSDIVTPLPAREMVWFIYFGVNFFYLFIIIIIIIIIYFIFNFTFGYK